MLNVVYPKIKVPSGIRSYVERILHGLTARSYPYKGIGIRKVEFSFRGKPIGGIASQKVFSSLHSFNEHPIHSLAPEVTPKGADIVTILDIIPFIESARFINSSYDKIAYNMMYENALNAKVLIAGTMVGKEELINELKLEKEKVRLVYHSIDSSRFYFEPENPYPNDGKYHLVTVGDFNPRKRFDLLYKIVAKMDDVELFHIGPTNSWNERASQLRQAANESKNISMLGSVDDATLRKYYSHADLFVYISDAEGFGYTPLEAMACRSKVLVNDIPVFKETMGDVGFVSDIENFKDAVYKSLDKKIDGKKLQEYSSKFSLEREIGNLIAIYDEFKGN